MVVTTHIVPKYIVIYRMATVRFMLHTQTHNITHNRDRHHYNGIVYMGIYLYGENGVSVQSV